MRRTHFISAILAVGLGAGAVIAVPVAGGHDAAATADAVTTLPVTFLDVVFIAAAILVIGAWLKLRLYRLPQLRNDALTLPAEYLLVFLAAMLLATALGQTILQLISATSGSATTTASSDDDLAEKVRTTAIIMSGQLLVAGVYMAGMIARSRRAAASPDQPICRWSHGRAALLALISFPAIFLLMMIVSFSMTLIVWMLQSEQPPTIAHTTLESIATAQEPMWKAAMIFLVVCVVPIVEELLYRGLLQELFSRLRLGQWSAIFMTSLGFTAMHIGAADVHVLPSLFLLSLALGWVYAKTGRLLAPILLHAAFNAANTALLLLPTSGG